jgi:hypothetical protein
MKNRPSGSLATTLCDPLTLRPPHDQESDSRASDGKRLGKRGRRSEGGFHCTLYALT